jgi:hypothetical protein
LINRSGSAYELKVQLPQDLAQDVEAWVRQRMTPDPHGEDGRYRTTSLYCDTSLFDVYRRAPGFKRSKYRLRRYGEAAWVYLERKTRQGDRVWKRRDSVDQDDLAFLAGVEPAAGWPGSWFLQRIRRLDLRPTVRIGYTRTAFIGGTVEDPLRLTLDRNLVGVPTRDWQVTPVADGRELLPGGVVLEMKFRDVLPGLFRELLAQLPPELGRVSKYRTCIRTWGLAGEEV